MKRFSKDDDRTRAEIVDELNGAVADIDSEFEKVEAAVQAFNQKVDAYNGVLQKARDWQSDVVQQIDDYMGEKSEKWLDGDAGQAYQSWRDDIENETLDDIDQMEVPEKPEPDHVGIIENFPGEVNA